MSDAAANFVKTAVIGSYDASNGSIVVEDVARMPAPPFNLTWWNATDYGDPSDDPFVEIVRCTAINIQSVGGEVQSTLIVSRGQEGEVATAKALPDKVYKVMAGLTAGMWNALTGAGGSTSLFQAFFTLAALKGATAGTFVPNKVYMLMGLTSGVDVFRVYKYDSASVEVANDYSIVAPANVAGRLVLVFG